MKVTNEMNVLNILYFTHALLLYFVSPVSTDHSETESLNSTLIHKNVMTHADTLTSTTQKAANPAGIVKKDLLSHFRYTLHRPR